MSKLNQWYAACSCHPWTQKTVSLEKRLRKEWTKQRKDSRALVGYVEKNVIQFFRI